MKEKEEKIDMLFERNVTEQLAGFDWDRLSEAICHDLDQARRDKAATGTNKIIFKVAAGIAAAAAVVFVAVMVRINEPADMQLASGRRAVVKFIETKGCASVEIKSTGGKSEVIVDVGMSQRKVARCDVKIIDSNGGRENEGQRSAWIIIKMPEPVFADNGVSRDMRDVIYLF